MQTRGLIRTFVLFTAIAGLALTILPHAESATPTGPTFIVDTTGDTSGGACLDANAGDCTLRSAIELANAAPDLNLITFDNSLLNQIITITGSELPIITNPIYINAYTISGCTYPTPCIGLSDGSAGFNYALYLEEGASGSTIDGLAIIGWTSGVGIELDGADNVLIKGTYLGVDLSNTAAGNGVGIKLLNDADDNVICDVRVAFNLSHGILIEGGSRNKIVRDTVPNLIFNNGAGGNGDGIRIEGGEDNLIEGNDIHDNNGAGVYVGLSQDRNTISENSIYENTGQGIDLDEGANNGIDTPDLESASTNGTTTKIIADLPTDGQPYTVEVFSNSSFSECNDEGRTFIGSATVTGAQDSVITLNSPVAGGTILTINITDEQGNTSEFSDCVTVADVAGSVDLNIQKSADDDGYFVGETIFYTLTVTNFGGADAVGVQVDDFLDSSDITWGAITAQVVDGPACNISVTMIDCPGLTLPAGDSLQVIITAVIADLTAADKVSILNNASVLSNDTTDPSTDNFTDLTVSVSGVQLDITDNPDPVDYGGQIIYTVTVTNLTSSVIYNLDVFNSFVPIPDGQLLSASCGPSPCVITNLAPGDAFSYTVTTQAKLTPSDLPPAASTGCSTDFVYLVVEVFDQGADGQIILDFENTCMRRDDDGGGSDDDPVIIPTVIPSTTPTPTLLPITLPSATPAIGVTPTDLFISGGGGATRTPGPTRAPGDGDQAGTPGPDEDEITSAEDQASEEALNGCGFVPYESRSAQWRQGYTRLARPGRFTPQNAQEQEVLSCPEPPTGVICFPQTDNLLDLAEGDITRINLIDIQGTQRRTFEAPGQITGDEVCVDFDTAALGAACGDGCALAPVQQRGGLVPQGFVIPLIALLFILGGLIWLIVLLLARRRREEAEDDLEADLTA